MTNQEYKAYKQAVDTFFKEEGINCLTVSYENNTVSCSFSKSSCDCCGSTLHGNRTDANGYCPDTNEVYEYQVCGDCIYYSTYGELDDQTMLDMQE